VLKVDGWLQTDDVEELRQLLASVDGLTALDLSHLQSADREGLAVLRDLVLLGTEIRGASPYMELLLKTKP
jgi:hypothetical protein